MSAGVVMFGLDALLIALAWPLALLLAVPAAGGRSFVPDPAGVVSAVLYPIAMLLCLYALGLYRRDSMLRTRGAAGRIPLAAVLAGLISLSAGRLLPLAIGGWPAPAHEALLFSVAAVTFSAAGVLARVAFVALRRSPRFRPHLLVVGAGARAWDLAWMLRREGRFLAYDLTFLHTDAWGPLDERLAADPTVSVVRAPASVLAEAIRVGASDIVVAPDERRGMNLEELLACKTAGFPVEQYLSFVEREIRRVDLKRMELSWVVYSEGFRFNAVDRACKRLIDIAASLLILGLASPFLAAAMLAVALDDGFPVLYRQTRVTQDGRHFEILKLRTMRRDAEAGGAVWAAAADSRITRVGGFLRRTRLDELPQLFNVLRGDMSLVGPRPERPQFVAQLAEALPLYTQRHMVKAGLTGWAQVNYPYGASIDDARSKLSYDLYYVKNFSVLFDILVLLQTVRVVLWPSGVR